MGCTLSKNNKVSPAEITPSAKRGRFTNLKLWIGKKRCALFQQKVRRNQVVPLNTSPEDDHLISSGSSYGTTACYTPSTPLSSSTSSCSCSSCVSGTTTHSTEGSEESYHGNFESRKGSPILFSSPLGSPANCSMNNTSFVKSVLANAGIDANDAEAERVLENAKAMVMGAEVDDKAAELVVGAVRGMVAKVYEEMRQQQDWDSDDEDESEETVNLDGILRVTPIRPPTSAQTVATHHDGRKALTRVDKSDSVLEKREPKYANSTEELEDVINMTFKKYNLKMPEEEWKLEEKDYNDPYEELGDVIQQIFKRWNIPMSGEEGEMPSTSTGVGVTPNQAFSSTSRKSTSALTYPSSSNNGRRTTTTEARLPPRIRQQARPKAAHGARTDPTRRGFELPSSAFQRKF